MATTLKELYTSLKEDGAPVPDSYEQFKSYMESGPNGGYDHRKQVYDALKADGAPLPDTYEQFKNALFKTVAVDAVDAEDPEDAMAAPAEVSDPVEAVVEQPKPTPKREIKPRPRRNWSAQLPEWKKAAMIKRVQGQVAQFKANKQEGMQRAKRVARYATSGAAMKRQAMKGDLQYNPSAKKVEQQFITPTGEDVTNKNLADQLTRQYNDYVDNMTISGKLRKAHQRLRDLEQQMAERGEQLMAEHEQNKPGGITGFMAELGQIMGGDKMGGATAENPEDWREFTHDKDYQALHLASRKVKQEIQQLNNAKQKEEHGERFWHDLGRNAWQAIANRDAWDFGKGQLQDASAMMNIASRANRGEELSRAETDAMTELYLHNEIMNLYGDLGRGARWGDIAGGSLSFMKDFLLTGGFGGLTTHVPAKVATKVAINGIKKRLAKGATDMAVKRAVAGSVSRQVAENGLFATLKAGGKGTMSKFLAEQGKLGAATLLTTKALGVGAEDLLVRAPLMAATVQGQNLVGDIIETKLGPVIQDQETGELHFTDDKTWGEAAWQAGADRVIENFSEMWGAHLPGVSDITRAFGARKLTAAILRSTREGAGTILSKTNKFLTAAGINGYFGEVGEEYYGQLWRTMLNLDSAKAPKVDAAGNIIYKTDKNGEPVVDKNGQPIPEMVNAMSSDAAGDFHGDIWGGMLLSIGMTGGGAMTVNYGIKGVGKGINRIQYTKLKHDVNLADARASELMTPQVWDNTRALIDATDNADMGKLAEQVLKDNNINDAHRQAMLDYMEKSLILRGHNLGEYARKKAGEVNTPEEEAMADSYADGYNATEPEEMNDAKNMLDLQRQRLASATSEDMIAQFDQDPIGVLSTITDPELRKTAIDYINAKQVYDGMIQHVRDDIDERIARSDAMIDSRVHRESGQLLSAAMKMDERPVFVINGNVVMNEDGSSVDTDKSSESVIIRDADTGKIEIVNPSEILRVDEPADVEEEKEAARQVIRQQVSQTAANNIDGVLTFEPGSSFIILNDQGQPTEVVILQQSVDGNGMPIEGAFDVQYDGGVIVPATPTSYLQQQYDLANQQRASQFDAEKQQERAADKEAESQEQIDPNITAYIDPADMQGIFEAIDAGELPEMPTAEDLKNFGLSDSQVIAALTTLQNLAGQNANVAENGQENIENADIPAETASEIDNSVGNGQQTPSALEQIPVDENGNFLWHEVEPGLAWDALMEDADDESVAQEFIQSEIDDLTAELKKVQKEKPNAGLSSKDKLAFLKDKRARTDAIQSRIDHYKSMSEVAKNRKSEEEALAKAAEEEAKKAAAAQKAAEEKAEAERQEELAKQANLEDVPEFDRDTPADARLRGFRRVYGHKVERPAPITNKLEGNDVGVKFSDDVTVNGKLVVIDVKAMEPSHLRGTKNQRHFLNEAQPKNRTDQASKGSGTKIATDINPKEITDGVTAFTGAPVVNARGEVIQGNSRGNGLRVMYEDYKDSAEKYRQYLIDHAAEFGMNAEDIAKMAHPVQVRMIDVEDNEAIQLGQFEASDTESGGESRIKAANLIQKLGDRMKEFVSKLMNSVDEEATFAQLLDKNGADVIDWLKDLGYITPTQYQTAIDGQGNLTAEGKNDLEKVLSQTIFQGAPDGFEARFAKLPAKARNAILATAYRDMESDSDKRMIKEIHQSVILYDKILSYLGNKFTGANEEKTRNAVKTYMSQYAADDITGDPYLPSDIFSNFAVELATMYRFQPQKMMTGIFSKMYDMIQGKQEATLIDEADNTHYSLADTIKAVLNLDYKPINNTKNGNNASNDVDEHSADGQGGEQGGAGDASEGEQIPTEGESTDSGAGTSSDSGAGSQVATPSLGGKIASAEADVNTDPTDAQKKAGNYKKGHVKIDGLDITIEQPKGSIRKGTDATGRAWEQEMHNTYGYIRGTEGVDGDHIDVFLSDSPEEGDVFVVDQVNKDGSFDEHKVMYGFADEESAREAYLSNYEEGWTGLGNITRVSKEDFKKWIESSHRKTKPFAEYSIAQRQAEAEKATQEAEDKRILTADEIEAADVDDIVKDNALAYIEGDVNPISTLAYNEVKKYYAGSKSTDSTGDSEDADQTQLGTTDDADGGSGSRQGGGENSEVDQGDGGEDVSGDDGHGKDSKDGLPEPTGGPGNPGVPGGTSGSGKGTGARNRSPKRGKTGSDGNNVRGRNGRAGGKTSSANDAGGNAKTANGTAQVNSNPNAKPGDANIEAGLQGLKDLWKDIKKEGRQPHEAMTGYMVKFGEFAVRALIYGAQTGLSTYNL